MAKMVKIELSTVSNDALLRRCWVCKHSLKYVVRNLCGQVALFHGLGVATMCTLPGDTGSVGQASPAELCSVY